VEARHTPIDTMLSCYEHRRCQLSNRTRSASTCAAKPALVSRIHGNRFAENVNDITDYKAMLQVEVNTLNAVNVDSMPKGYATYGNQQVIRSSSTIANETVMEKCGHQPDHHSGPLSPCLTRQPLFTPI
jgi:hypothetical protein